MLTWSWPPGISASSAVSRDGSEEVQPAQAHGLGGLRADQLSVNRHLARVWSDPNLSQPAVADHVGRTDSTRTAHGNAAAARRHVIGRRVERSLTDEGDRQVCGRRTMGTELGAEHPRFGAVDRRVRISNNSVGGKACL